MNLWDLLESSKWLARQGWMMRGIPTAIAETVSQHSWETGLIAYLIASRVKPEECPLNPYKAGMLGLVHDLLEGVLGDIPRYTSLQLGDLKNSLEEKAISELEMEPSLRELLKEWEEGATPESKAARIADSLSTYLQALRYMRSGYGRALEIAETSRRKAIDVARGTCFETVVAQVLSDIERALLCGSKS
ncbi:HD domain-containing protein [Infirmifilum sp. SLHALR2]|nr:MAG: hypothetical protein B7L53_07290 [Thermofilum sp. NZ13]